MVRGRSRKNGLSLSALFLTCCLIPAQQPPPPPRTHSRPNVVEGQPTPYLVRHLPVSSFPDLPAGIQDLLNRRGCQIPQTYQAHRPENVVQASLERRGSSDWAVLCSAQGNVSLLVFFASNAAQPMVLATAPETRRLQAHDPTGVLGFNWGIDPASPQRVREAQTAMLHRPPRIDHDALADSIVDHRIIYHFYSRSAWTTLEIQD
jgi:hypothetical protein